MLQQLRATAPKLHRLLKMMLMYFLVQFIRHKITLARNSVLVSSMRDQLDRGEKPADGRKTVKAQVNTLLLLVDMKQ